MKSGYKLPIPKKGKSTLLCTNHRGITITSIFGKVLEHLILGKTKDWFKAEQSDLQFGFTEGLSPVVTSLCLTEAIAQAYDTKSGLVVSCLDAQKAFDVVNHDILRLRINSASIRGKMWLLIDDLHQNAQEVVRWRGIFSGEYMVRQGVRQGGILSTHLYKSYINKLLKMFEKSGLEMTIGSLYLGAPTCADDILLIANTSFQSQAMLDLSVNYSVLNKYSIHPVKSTVTPYIKLKLEATTHAHSPGGQVSEQYSHSLIWGRSWLRAERHLTSTCGSSWPGTISMHYSGLDFMVAMDSIPKPPTRLLQHISHQSFSMVLRQHDWTRERWSN